MHPFKKEDDKILMQLNGMFLNRNLVVLLIVILVSCKNVRNEETIPVKINEYHNTAHLIEAENIKAEIGVVNRKIIDFRKEEDYLKGHIPGAIQMYRTDIQDENYPFKGMMASKEKIEQLLSKKGIGANDTLIIYDDKGGPDAARLWWVLQNYNHKKVKLLNGGLHSWKAIHHNLERKPNTFQATNFKLPEVSNQNQVIHREKLKHWLQNEAGIKILDVRTPNEFSGKRQKSGAFRAGRLPKSQLIDWSASIDFSGSQKFLSFEELNDVYANSGFTKEDTIVVYCHSGVRSAHTTFVLTELLGYDNVMNYDGSWVEWSHFKSLPIERDSITVIRQ